MRPAQRTSSARSPEGRQKDLDRLIKRSRREQERLQWEFLYERRRAARPSPPSPTEEATQIWHLQPDKTRVLRLLCGACPTKGPRPRVGAVYATPRGRLLVAIYDGPDPRGTEASGSLRRFWTGQWLDGPPQPFAARCGRCRRFCIDATGELVAEVKDRVRQGERHLVVYQRYYPSTT